MPDRAPALRKPSQLINLGSIPQVSRLGPPTALGLNFQLSRSHSSSCGDCLTDAVRPESLLPPGEGWGEGTPLHVHQLHDHRCSVHYLSPDSTAVLRITCTRFTRGRGNTKLRPRSHAARTSVNWRRGKSTRHGSQCRMIYATKRRPAGTTTGQRIRDDDALRGGVRHREAARPDNPVNGSGRWP